VVQSGYDYIWGGGKVKQTKDNIPTLFAAVMIVLCLLAVSVLLGPAFFPSKTDVFYYVDKGDLVIGESLTGQFIDSPMESSGTESHVYSFDARENQLITFNVELQSLDKMYVCIAETPTSEDCSLSHHGLYEDEGSLEFDVLIPHDGQYFVVLGAGGQKGGYQISIELDSE
jgi:hypothetical protein